MKLDDETKAKLAGQPDQLPIPPAYRPTLTLSSDEVAQMRANVREWIKNPEKRYNDIQENAWLTLQILQKMMTSEIGGRSGPGIQARAAKDYARLAQTVMEIERAHKVLTMKKCPNCKADLSDLVEESR